MKDDNEISAMSAIAEALSSLEDEEVVRVLRWAVDRFQPREGRLLSPLVAMQPAAESTKDEGLTSPFESLADLFNSARPSTDAEKALVTGYWFQEHEGQTDLDAQAVNTALKHLGHGVRNITDAFSSLISQKPSLVLQVRKGGTSRQARKKYKITEAGKTEVKRMLSQKPATEEGLSRG